MMGLFMRGGGVLLLSMVSCLYAMLLVAIGRSGARYQVIMSTVHSNLSDLTNSERLLNSVQA